MPAPSPGPPHSFDIAGQGIEPLWNGMAIAADWVSAARFLSITGIGTTGIGTAGMIINFAVDFAVSRLTPAPSAEVQELVENVRYPPGTVVVAQTH